MSPRPAPSLSLTDVRAAPADGGAERVELVADRGALAGRLRDVMRLAPYAAGTAGRGAA